MKGTGVEKLSKQQINLQRCTESLQDTPYQLFCGWSSLYHRITRNSRISCVSRHLHTVPWKLCCHLKSKHHTSTETGDGTRMDLTLIFCQYLLLLCLIIFILKRIVWHFPWLRYGFCQRGKVFDKAFGIWDTCIFYSKIVFTHWCYLRKLDTSKLMRHPTPTWADEIFRLFLDFSP